MADTRQQPPTRFSQEEAADIIREATTRSLAGDAERPLTREDVHAMAREMGLSEAAVEAALAARARKQEDRQRVRKAIIDFATHGLSYTIVMGGLTIMDLLGGPGWWVQWPAIGWGMGLAFHAKAALLNVLNKDAPPDGKPGTPPGS
ncbi:2TM domain-containing protein [Pyxidicoccus xibeiensis]|uniref:2TM domain-containing protein n=1 Tax=Pyxidicoccus xibeiensis TaxID=2906759 RepID=UPI0020A816AB|nr:2TM domain-containing protein [Pyxidicoccus xibeiensis]MCP3138250.1 2TM domain-containing protein [Pyxidicoccus xibeiensis]